MMVAQAEHFSKIKREEAGRSRLRLYAAALFSLTFLVPFILVTFDYSFRKFFLALVLVDVCLYPLFRYLSQEESGIPVLPLLCIAYAAQFALPIFTREPIFPIAYDEIALTEAQVEMALLMAIAGVVVLQAAFYLSRTKRIANALPVARLMLNQRKAEIFCLIIFVASFIQKPIQSLFTEVEIARFSSIFNLLNNQILVAIGILAWIVYSGRGTRWHKALLYLVVGITMVRGSSTTMMETMLVPVVVLFTTKWMYTKRLPVLGFILIAGIILFLSPVKHEVRATAGVDVVMEKETSSSERAWQWTSQAAEFWIESFSGERTFSESASDLTLRTDLIHQFSYIYSATPSIVPFQNGSSYQYFAVALIPRIVWPEKPEVNSTNNFYALSYGISTEQVIENSTFGVSLIGEGYMNFGFIGVLLAMAFQGLCLSLLEQIFGGPGSGSGGMAIFIATFVFFLNGIGSSAEIMFGGILQNLLCSCILLWWAAERIQKQSPPGRSLKSLYR